MSKTIAIVIVLFVLGAGVLYAVMQNLQSQKEHVSLRQERVVVLPIAEYAQRRTFNGFGEFFQASLTGYHVAQDIEYADVLGKEVPVFAIAPGVVRHKGNVSGYGGVVVILHDIEGRAVNAIYGHIDLLSLQFQKGDSVQKGEFLANLGDHESKETDGERKHLHFALYEGEELRLQGYESSVAAVNSWINPYNFFEEYGYDMQSPARMFNAQNDLGGNTYPLAFLIPQGWEVEYVRSKDALNLYTLAGKGTALERSEVFIEHFDATDFLTLPSVTIYQVKDVLVGANYTAREYDIEKNKDAPLFAGQPLWRNVRHRATDFRGSAGRTRYFTIAANPQLDIKTYEQILASMKIVK